MNSEPLNMGPGHTPGPFPDVDLINQGISGLKQISELLAEHRRTTEQAALEIFAIMENADALLEEVGTSGELGEKSLEPHGKARDQLSLIFSALQFQDIASQQGEAMNALLSTVGRILVALAGDAAGVDRQEIAVREGTFDARATFDRGRALQEQEEIDRIFSQSTGEVRQEEEAP